jgi:hypothetical protein
MRVSWLCVCVVVCVCCGARSVLPGRSVAQLLHRKDPSDARYARINFSRQGSFEVGMLLHFIATHEEFLLDYPTGYGDRVKT